MAKSTLKQSVYAWGLARDLGLSKEDFQQLLIKKFGVNRIPSEATMNDMTELIDYLEMQKRSKLPHGDLRVRDI